MKTKIVTTFIFLLVFVASVVSQTQWTKYAGNPVLVKGPAAWDAIAIGQPTVIWENDTLKMWYIGVGADFKGRLCYAWSLDGVAWTKHSAPVMDVGGAGTWDCGWLDTPEIVRDSSGYKLYYYGDTAWQFSAISSAMGVAYSVDGINWTKEPNNPVFTKSNVGDWDGTWVESPAVIFDYNINGPYKMWYNGVDTATWKVLIGLATSMDGITWVKHTGNPVLDNGPWGSYDDMWLGTPAILYHGGMYEMWYASTAAASYNTNTSAFDTVNICYASSADGISWTKHPLNPLFHTFTTPYDSLLDTGGPWAPDVVYNPNTQTYMMWFETGAGFMFATAPDNSVPVREAADRQNLNIFPVPSSGLFSINIPVEDPGSHSQIYIYNQVGALVWQAETEHNKMLIDLSAYPAGLYVVRVLNGSKVLSGKVVIL